MKYLTFLLFFPALLPATEGMWLPLLLQDLNEAEMRELGMELTAEDIYNINRGSLKDAIVHFGGFCTGEVISDRGLVLTNHHCGYGAIQDHSSLENNYLANGFWAMEADEEIPNPGLFVTFIDRIEDVSRRVLTGVTDDLTERERKQLVQKNLEQLRLAYRLLDFEELLVKPFYGGNKYYAFVTVTYPDVRLVGAPPSSIGKFGADTDNWEWPRHTGDFSLFRIYTAPGGGPAPYAEENVPLRPKHHLTISTAGIAPGDFSMVFGFPGTTDHYLPATALRQRTEIVNPIRVAMRDRSLAVIDSAMRADEQIRIDYASKQARIANAWKKWRGESQGVAAVDAVARREEFEDDFLRRLQTKPSGPRRYGDLLPRLDSLYAARLPLERARAYMAELNYTVDLLRIANVLDRQFRVYDENGPEAFLERVPRIADYLRDFYDGYHPEVDRPVAAALLEAYYTEVPDRYRSPYADDQRAFAGGTRALVERLFASTYLTRGDKLLAILRNDPSDFVERLRADPAFQFVRQLNGFSERRVLTPYNAYAERINALQRQYMEGLLRYFPDRRFYPDANGTMRVSYGQFEGFTGLAGEEHDHMTYLDGVVAKYQPGDYEFDLPARLLELHERRDYGPYATGDGRLPVCILGSNHTTGGNSGSPALNGRGQLVGLNFDRTWQSTMSDVHYDPDICRNIMVDIRYVLWLVDKFAGAGYLVEEMELD